MSFDDEWQRAKALVAGRDDLGRVGHAAYRLHGGLRAAGRHAKVNSEAAGAELAKDHFATGSALTRLADTWQTQVDTLLEACAHISNHLDHSATRYREEDAKIETGMHDARRRLMTPSRIAEYYR
ncbi:MULTISPECIES: hypothetical protein [Streptomyces]|uniref:Excreted virulence factor EspC, type VII ESX diderm n=1 Tax=Streptomyces lonegramiae TaxID=3075524 RepID=A0ABU2XEF0_9ACTN|nr:hypothetical protein [Streptomyces sp. DSM 41529]MDT0543505.1 hypothetical protein [Streptomyces sp. DSM 41529]